MNDLKGSTTIELKGIPAAPGMASGPALLIKPHRLVIPRSQGNEAAMELQRLATARAKAGSQLARLSEKLAQAGHSAEAAIFSAHSMFIDDVALLKNVGKSIHTGLNAEAAWMDAIEAFAVQMEALPDPTLQARAADVRDAGRRVLANLMNIPLDDLQLDQPAVVMAEDMTPSQTAALDKEKVLGFCIAGGGPTSHTAILAKALGVPAVVGLGPRIIEAEAGSLVLVDGNQGSVTVNPDKQTKIAFDQAQKLFRDRKESALAKASLPAVTLDGIQPEIFANIGGVNDAGAAVEFGAGGVGLFRTEFLFLERRDLPTEEEQVRAYRQVFDRMGGLPVVVRTLDIGGDKTVSYLGITQEANPFLGWRAIRMNEGRPDVFTGQVRALLRAGDGKDVRIMLPMVSSAEEITLARQLFDGAADSLRREGLPCAQGVQFGIMVEIPSAALTADRLALLVDFFSIGTNDLTQYTLAVDRTNARIANLASPYHPAVLRLIQMTIDAAHKHGKWAGVCGEMAGDVLAVPLLLGMGLDEFSMAPAMIPAVKQAVRHCDTADCRRIAGQCLVMTTTTEVIHLLTAEAERLRIR